MKHFSYTWVGDIFLLHLELNNAGRDQDYEIHLIRRRSGQGDLRTSEVVRQGQVSYRFMISRTHPSETSIEVHYPEEICLKAYELDDRAYYPTTPFFEG